jgi:hypothetical protein
MQIHLVYTRDRDERSEIHCILDVVLGGCVWGGLRDSKGCAMRFCKYAKPSIRDLGGSVGLAGHWRKIVGMCVLRHLTRSLSDRVSLVSHKSS